MRREGDSNRPRIGCRLCEGQQATLVDLVYDKSMGVANQADDNVIIR